MICPKCKAESRSGFDTCSDCKVLLVDHLSQQDAPEEQAEDIDYVEIERVHTFSDLATIKAIFEGEGIKYFLWGEQMIGAGVMSGGGAARLFVAASDESRAREILNSLSLDERHWLF